MRKKRKSLLVVFFLSAFFIFFLNSTTVFGAGNSKLYFSNTNIVITPGLDFSVNVFLDTEEPINALDLEIVYPKDKIKFLNSSNALSIVNVWPTSPVLLPSGNIHLAGGLLKSFIGQGGLIIKLSFKTISAGQAELSFGKNDVYIADGKGTKLENITLPITFSIIENSTSLVDNLIVPITSPLIPEVVDNTPPEISFQLTKNPVDSATLIAFLVIDLESGIKQTQMRIKKWFSYSSWQDVRNPVVYPYDVWNIELKVINNAGLESIKSIPMRGELYRKIFVVFFLFFVVLFIIIWVYNNIKRKL